MSIKQIDGYKVYLGRLLGQGAYGAVYEGLNDKTQEKVAIKLLKKANIDADDYLKAALFSQIKILQSVKSPNIVGFEDVMESNQFYYVIQQLCDGDLSRIMKPGARQPEDKAIELLTHISNGFLALVRQGIIHRDLKPANIMTKKGVLKIGDFGFAKRVTNKKVGHKTIVGTPLYMSLQILKGQQYSSKADIWAIGFIFYELLHGDTPWMAKSQYELVKLIQNKPLKFKEGLHPNTIDFITKCLGKEEVDRISWDQYFVHPIFNGCFDEYASQNKQFENKLKSVMSQLRFKINSQNLDLCKILVTLGYNSSQNQMKFPEFFQFLKTINPLISQNEAVYMFEKTDTDNSGTISIKEIEQQMTNHNISLQSAYNRIPAFRSHAESFTMIAGETEQKIKSCFKKIEQVIIRKGVTLLVIFNQFDKDKSGKMTFKEFKYMIGKLSKDFSDDQLQSVFDLIDEDHSNTIEFQELNRYYSKVNGIPESMNARTLNQETIFDCEPQQNQKMDLENKSAYMKTESRHNNNHNQQPMMGQPMMGQPMMGQPMMGQPMMGQPNQFNPFYNPYPPNNQSYPQIFPNMQPNYGYYPQSNIYPYPPPPMNNQNSNHSPNTNQMNQSNGVFGNFIMDQLSSKMSHQSGNNWN